MAEINSSLSEAGVTRLVRVPFSSGRRVRRRGPAALVAAMLAIAATAAGCGEAGATITRLTVGSPGADPYTLVSGSDKQVMASRPLSGGQTTGDSPGLYGGTRRTASCDPAKLLKFLQTNPAKAKAWAAVHRISSTDIETFLGKLTPVTLRVDTLVTNHGYSDGKPTNFTAVLQSGIGVLVDAYGAPVVKCNCGNPLTAADKKIKPQKAKYTGRSWPQFSNRKVTIVKPRDKAKGPLETFTLIDPDGTVAFTRPMGTMGDADGPPAELPPAETLTPTDGTGTPTGPTGDPSATGTDPTDGTTGSTDPSPGSVDPSTSPGDSSPGAGGGDDTTDPAIGSGQTGQSPEGDAPAPEPDGGTSAPAGAQDAPQQGDDPPNP